MADAPRVTVLTCAYNVAAYLAETVASVRAQTLADFEYILVDDGSTDGTLELMHALAGQDARLRVLSLPRNMGMAAALNQGLAQARAPYVAAMDGDDVCAPDRLAAQVAWLEAHPQVGVLGTAARLIDADGAETGERAFPAEPALARWELIFRCSLLHSAMTFRRELAIGLGGYQPNPAYAVEYDLLARMSDRAALANLPEKLVAYRLRPGQLSDLRRGVQYQQVLLLQYTLGRRWAGVQAPLPEYGFLYGATRGQRQPLEVTERAAALLEQLALGYLARQALGPDEAALVRADCALKLAAMAHQVAESADSLPGLLARARHWDTAVETQPRYQRYLASRRSA